jgi:hypothetical protein
MPNKIKYSASALPNTLRSGNVLIGMNDVEYGPTSSTGFWNGIDLPSGGYCIYNPASNGSNVNIYRPANDTELVKIINEISSNSFTTAAQVLAWGAAQTSVVIVNRDYENIVTDGLVLNLDAGYTVSYPKDGTTWYDLSGNAGNSTLVNGPSYSSDNGGCISLDGSNDLINGPNNVTWFSNSSFTIESWFKFNSSPPTEQLWFSANQSPPGETQQDIHLRVMSGTGLRFGFYGNDLDASNVVSHSNWYQVICSYDYSTDNSKIFVNGSQVATGSAGPYTPIDANVGIGYWRGRNVQYFKGNIAITRVYNRALSATEIAQNFNAQKSRYGLI